MYIVLGVEISFYKLIEENRKNLIARLVLYLISLLVPIIFLVADTLSTTRGIDCECFCYEKFIGLKNLLNTANYKIRCTGSKKHIIIPLSNLTQFLVFSDSFCFDYDLPQRKKKFKTEYNNNNSQIKNWLVNKKLLTK